MENIVQEFIEENIDLLDINDWGEFFNRAEQRCINTEDFDFTSRLRVYLEEAGLDPFKYLDYIPYGYYEDDYSIVEYDVSGDIITIQGSAFYSCGNLRKIKLPNTLVDIQDNAFNLCEDLEYIELPNSLEYIHSDAFANSGLKKCTYLGTIEQFMGIELGDTIFENTELAYIQCSDGIIEIDENGEPII